MKHYLYLYDMQDALIQEEVVDSWEKAKIVLEGWNRTYGDSHIIWYKRKGN